MHGVMDEKRVARRQHHADKRAAKDARRQRREFCGHVKQDARGRWVSTVKHVAEWLDTCGIKWTQEECHRCGRVWRRRWAGARPKQ